MPYHVVCHDCTREGVVDEETIAREQVRSHRRETGHSVEYAEIANGADPTGPDPVDYGVTDD